MGKGVGRDCLCLPWEVALVEEDEEELSGRREKGGEELGRS